MERATRADFARKKEVRLIRRIEQAEWQFKLAIAVWATVHSGGYRLNYADAYDDGAHTLTREEMRLTPDEEEMASNLMLWSTARLLAVQMNAALERISPNHFGRPREELRTAITIVRLVRNAFAHNPFEPIWDMEPEYRDKVFEVPGIIHLDTHGTQGAVMVDRHLGGRSALLRLAQWLRSAYSPP